jgi:hypothetical protein
MFTLYSKQVIARLSAVAHGSFIEFPSQLCKFRDTDAYNKETALRAHCKDGSIKNRNYAITNHESGY